MSRQSGPRRKTTTCRRFEPGVQRPASAIACITSVGASSSIAAGLRDFAQHVHEPLRALHEHERHMHARNRGVVLGVDFLPGFVEREVLHEHAVDAGQLDVAGRRDRYLNLQAAERAGAAVDRVQQVFELRIHRDRRNRDRRHADNISCTALRVRRAARARYAAWRAPGRAAAA